MAKSTTKSSASTVTYMQPMLENGFGSELENAVAALNNMLCREGRTAQDPASMLLGTIKSELGKMGVSFDIVPRPLGLADATPKVTVRTETPPATPKKRRKQKKTKQSKAKATTSDGTVDQRTIHPMQRKAAEGVRKIDHEELERLQVAGTVDENADAPYGCDSDGNKLAPYGVKTNGMPAKRRGKVAVASPTETEATEKTEPKTAPKAETKPKVAPETQKVAPKTEPSTDTTAVADADIDLTDLDDLDGLFEDAAIA
tara:strand:+ start:8621 stop:9394 length:774 start_codon:yes stop_codon:yes gene_type:complete